MSAITFKNHHSPSPQLQTQIKALSIRANELVEAAEIIRSQLSHRNRIWINSMVSRDIGSDVSLLVFEKTRRRDLVRAGDRGYAMFAKHDGLPVAE
jgi:hypothetical protein